MTDQLPAKTEEAKPLTKYQTLERDFNSDRFQTAIANALPKSGVDSEKFVRFALTAINKNPKLSNCTRTSVAQCLLDCASMGIEPDGRRAHLIPYNTKVGDKWVDVCQLQLDYKGIVELVRRSGSVSNISCNIVYSHDEFDFMEGTGAFLRHKRVLKDRGDPMCFYSFITFKDGSESFEIMTIEEVNAVRDKSQGYIAAKKSAKKYNKPEVNHPWVQHHEAMGRKTVFKRHSKWLTLSPEIHDAIVKDDKNEYMSPSERADIAKPAMPAESSDIFNQMDDKKAEVHSEGEAVDTEIVEPEKKEEKKATPSNKGKVVDEFRSQLEMLDIKELEFLQWCQENKHLNWKKEEPPTLDALSAPKLKELEPDLMTIAEQIQAK
jgi:recombination protein RecT